MWTLPLVCVLGLCLTRVHGADSLLHTNSTQMHYVTLLIDKEAWAEVSGNLLHKDYDDQNSFSLQNLKKTTECDVVDNQKTCRCVEGYRWKDTACSSPSQCCGTDVCDNPPDSCTSNQTVTLKGSLELKSSTFYHKCLDTPTSEPYKQCNDNLTREIQTFYSRIYGFDSLIILGYRVGSVIVDFQVVIAEPVKPSILQEMSQNLTSLLSANLNLHTSGVVHLSEPKGILGYGSNVTLSCTSTTDLGVFPSWKLTNYLNESKEIYTGTEATVTSSATESTIGLSPVSQLWRGWYSCSFVQKESELNIHHTALVHLDICVEPNITIRTNPGFPVCQEPNGLVAVIISCEVEQNYETYNVTWEKVETTDILKEDDSSYVGMKIFNAKTYVSCDATNPTVTCRLTNRCNQTRTASIKIAVIKVGDPVCAAEGDWKPTPVLKTAELKCSGSVGTKRRYCNGDTTWAQETSNCVNLELRRVLNNAITSDTGLGALQDNAQNVFHKLQSMTTQNSTVIGKDANLQTSVNVIKTMGEKLGSINKSEAVNDFLRTSSNLLNESLAHSWTSPQESENSAKGLAEAYLSSVEELIQKSGGYDQGTFQNLQVVNCSSTSSQCNNTVFKNTVLIDGDGSLIKTTGFLHLQNYFPNNSNDVPNSIVISTTRHSEKGNKLEGPVNIEIIFRLIQARPRNYRLKCVYWDTKISDWSENGCKWTGESTCKCTHLSSFAILMSKTKIEVKYLTELTYVGLSVSIVCLIICLVVELIIWHDVVKTDTLHLRHCAHVNISLCLLIGDICFVASSSPDDLSDIWCKTFVVVEHFCYLAMFFWMFCLSSILLHKTVYVSLHGVGKTAYLRFAMVVGYVCPLLIVVITFLANNGAEGQYYSMETRWLVYNGVLKGSIFSFILPVGIIFFVNIFFMCLVIMKLLQPIKAQQMLENKDKNSAKSVIRSVILLTPVFGLTWGLGFLMILFDLTYGPLAYAIHYLFTITNAFQGLFIFITTCVGDKMVRDGLLRYIRKKTTGNSSFSSSSSVDQSSIKKPAQN